MMVSDLKLNWADLREIKVSEITDSVAKKFIEKIDNQPISFDAAAYVCSDARFSGIRDILSSLPDMRVQLFSSAGNVVHSPAKLPSIVIGHGNSQKDGCGAVGYAKSHGEDDNEFGSIVQLVKKSSDENILEQFDKVGSEFRAGVFYFNHELGKVEKVQNEKYEKSKVGEIIFDKLAAGLKGKYTQEQLTSMAKGQNPPIIYLTNIGAYPTGTQNFSVQLQSDELHGIIQDSLKYAISHALKGHGSFENTATTIMAFDGNKSLPKGLDDFLNKETFIQDYARRNGTIYLVAVRNKDTKTVLMVEPR